MTARSHMAGDPQSRSATSRGVTVVVPIYDAFQATRRCVESLHQHCAEAQRILLLNDASSDRRMAAWLDDVAASSGGFEAHHREKNGGYTATINHGCELAGRDDVILLNSDTRVTRGWIDNLRDAAVSRPKVGTVTPLSNAAGAFSVPSRHRSMSLPDGVSADEMASLVEMRSERLRPEVPTGNGFCMYVRRECLDQVGLFDAHRFPRGYGEENDFCMRARDAGFVHLIEDSTFVFHERGASAGWSRWFLQVRAGLLLRWLHPEYRSLVAQWLADDPIDRLRRRLSEELGLSTGEFARNTMNKEAHGS